jgi:hypothetical protein
VQVTATLARTEQWLPHDERASVIQNVTDEIFQKQMKMKLMIVIYY